MKRYLRKIPSNFFECQAPKGYSILENMAGLKLIIPDMDETESAVFWPKLLDQLRELDEESAKRLN